MGITNLPTKFDENVVVDCLLRNRHYEAHDAKLTRSYDHPIFSDLIVSWIRTDCWYKGPYKKAVEHTVGCKLIPKVNVSLIFTWLNVDVPEKSIATLTDAYKAAFTGYSSLFTDRASRVRALPRPDYSWEEGKRPMSRSPGQIADLGGSSRAQQSEKTPRESDQDFFHAMRAIATGRLEPEELSGATVTRKTKPTSIYGLEPKASGSTKLKENNLQLSLKGKCMNLKT